MRRDAGLLLLLAGFIYGIFPPQPGERWFWLLAWAVFASAALIWLRAPARRSEERLREGAPDHAHDDWSMHLAHDFRTPLMRLRMHLSRLAEGGEQPGAGIVSAMEGEILKLERLAEDFIDLTAAHSQWGEGRGAPCDTAQVVQDVVDRVGPLFEMQGSEIACTAGPSARVDVDPALLERILDNLLSNALRYAEGEAPVELHVRMDGPLWVRITVANPAAEPSLALSELRRPFVRGDEMGDASQQEGFGLGLAVVDRLVQTAGGRLVLNYDGDARRFEATILLPRSAQHT